MFLNLVFLFSLFLFSCNGNRKQTETPSDVMDIGASTSHVSSDKQISTEALLDTIERLTFLYFWDCAEPNSGLARERWHEDGVYPAGGPEVVTSGGSGFGIMALIAGVERGYVSRDEWLTRMERIVSFIEKADRYYGAVPHWWDGRTGKTIPFSTYDDGGDLVETAFLMQGLLTLQQYLEKTDPLDNQNMIDNKGTSESTEELITTENADLIPTTPLSRERSLSIRIGHLWSDVDWNFYRQGNQQVLYWHWSPAHGWKMNFPVRGYNECLIMYLLAAASPTHAVPATVYSEGWAENGGIVSPHTVEGFPLHLHYQGGEAGPLFWAQYSFLGLNPIGLSDTYCPNYYNEMRNLTLVNRAYCIRNPHNYKGYSSDCWGLTAGYSIDGYAAHAPNNRDDRGVINPTAALSSIVYTPEYSLQVMRHLYNMGDKVLGPYGFYDAFSETFDWFPRRYLAIDQGPIVVMIENYRSGLLWNLFMSHPDVKMGMRKIGMRNEVDYIEQTSK